MITLFRRHTPTLPSIATGIRVKKFTIANEKPFRDVCFITHQVFELSDFTLRTEKEMQEFFESFYSIPFSFELWMIPSVFNTQKLIDNMKEEWKNNDTKEFIDFIQERMKPKSFRINRQFIVINRQESRAVKERVKELGLTFHEVPEMVAKVIKVKYEIEGEKRHEEMSV